MSSRAKKSSSGKSAPPTPTTTAPKKPDPPTPAGDKYADDISNVPLHLRFAFNPDLYIAEDLCGFNEIVVEEYCDAFQLSDLCGDGYVTYNEIPVILMRLGCFPRYKLNELASIQAGFLSAPYVFRRLEFVINGLDPRGTNMYDFQFFLRLMKIWGDNTKILGADELLEAFRLLDLDRTGLISPEEIRQIMSIFGDKLSPEEAEGMLDMADLDDNGQVDYEEFVAINLQQTMQGAGNKKKVQDALEKLEKRKAAALAGEQAGGGMKGDNFLSAGGDDDFLGGGGNPNNPF